MCILAQWSDSTGWDSAGRQEGWQRLCVRHPATAVFPAVFPLNIASCWLQRSPFPQRLYREVVSEASLLRGPDEGPPVLCKGQPHAVDVLGGVGPQNVHDVGDVTHPDSN